MASKRVLRRFILGALTCAALPALGYAAKASATGWIDGVWESPWPADQLRQPGDPVPPVEMGPPPLKPQYLAPWRAKQKEAADAVARGVPAVTDPVR